MDLLLYILFASSIVISVAFGCLKKRKKRTPTDLNSQAALDRYLKKSLSNLEIGIRYERYIGYLFESKGHHVVYQGVVKGFADRGIDLIVKSKNEFLVVQTKYWSQEKEIDEQLIFDLWVSTANHKLTLNENERAITRPIFFTTANYSSLAKEAAKLLGVEIKTEKLDRTYPIIKCIFSRDGEKFFISQWIGIMTNLK